MQERQLLEAERELVLEKEHWDRLPKLAPPSSSTASASYSFGATARGWSRAEGVYRPDDPSGPSFFRDMINARRGDPSAAERLAQSQRETLDQLSRERRDVVSSGGGAGLVPPLYLGELYAEYARAARPFADAIGSRPLPDAGMTLTIPKVVTGASVGVQATQSSELSNTDPDVDSVTAGVVTVGGYVDISLQTLERTMPGFDSVTFNDLRAGYDSLLDTQLLSGTGANGQHLGIRAVTTPNTVTYTSATPTGVELLPTVYDGISQIATNRHMVADWVLMHPRRAAWLGSETTTSATLFQQGELFGAPGTQQAGLVSSFGGLRVILDANIGTTYSEGGNTDEDEIYVCYSCDFLLFEGVPRIEVFRDVLSDVGSVRLRLYAYSAFFPHRQVKSISVISGSGLAAPSFS